MKERVNFLLEKLGSIVYQFLNEVMLQLLGRRFAMLICSFDECFNYVHRLQITVVFKTELTQSGHCGKEYWTVLILTDQVQAFIWGVCVCVCVHTAMARR